ncbi:MAG: sporulation integral membrane protein YlbJ [Clostridia bacterium]|jgi:sporulation integral membrane protein YlbJ|nr:sporulation integral membrane protein YlbJ [Clostridia bacterium]
MLFGSRRKRQYLYYAILALSVSLLALSMLVWPKETYQGASFGLELWATVLVPSLLPFFIITEILLGFGLVKVLGELLEPLMRPVFNLPGATSFALAMGFTSGFPIGAILTRRLYEEGLCSVKEGERLVSFTNNSSPLFILAAVGIGMFNDPALGMVLVCAHYLSNLLLGILLGLSAERVPRLPSSTRNIFRQSLHVFIQEQRKRKPLGNILKEAVKNGTNNIIQIGGFVVFFAVLTTILNRAGLLFYMSQAFAFLLQRLSLPAEVSVAVTKGFWEMTLGLQELSAHELPFMVKAIGGSIILGWSGLSIQAQVTSFLSGSGISPRLYYGSRILQAFLAGLIAGLLAWPEALWNGLTALPVFAGLQDTGYAAFDIKYKILYHFSFALKECLVILLGMLMLAILSALFLKGRR